MENERVVEKDKVLLVGKREEISFLKRFFKDIFPGKRVAFSSSSRAAAEAILSHGELWELDKAQNRCYPHGWRKQDSSLALVIFANKEYADFFVGIAGCVRGRIKSIVLVYSESTLLQAYDYVFRWYDKDFEKNLADAVSRLLDSV